MLYEKTCTRTHRYVDVHTIIINVTICTYGCGKAMVLNYFRASYRSPSKRHCSAQVATCAHADRVMHLMRVQWSSRRQSSTEHTSVHETKSSCESADAITTCQQRASEAPPLSGAAQAQSGRVVATGRSSRQPTRCVSTPTA